MRMAKLKGDSPTHVKVMASPTSGSPETLSSTAFVKVVKRRSKSGMRRVAAIAGILLLRGGGDVEVAAKGGKSDQQGALKGP